MSYEPYNFKGRLTDVPLTVAYGRQMDSLRSSSETGSGMVNSKTLLGQPSSTALRAGPTHPIPCSRARAVLPGRRCANYSVKDEVVVDVRTADVAMPQATVALRELPSR